MARPSALGLASLFLALSAPPLLAQATVDERVPAAGDGSVFVDVPRGTVTVSGWNRDEVSVTGTLAAGARRVAVRSGERKTRVEVVHERHPHQAGANLEVKVPAGSHVTVESFGGRIEVTDVKGAVHARTVNGSVTVAAAAGEVDAESVNGGVSVRGGSARVRATSVNGAVVVADGGGDVEASTVNGSVTVTATRAVQRARLDTVNGRLRFEGSLAPRATLEAETVSAAVELALVDPAADFEIYTFSGAIDNQLGPEVASGRASARELTFSTGGGGARVSVRTLSGHVSLMRAGARPRRSHD